MKTITLLFFICFSTTLFAHSGRTNSSGCHNDRKSGGYHCHNSKIETPSYEAVERSPSSDEVELDDQESLNYCCKVCSKGKACGDSCISSSKSCHKGAGCACDVQ